MKPYERNLKTLLELSQNGSESVYHPSSGISEPDLRYLRAKGLISLRPAGDNTYDILVEPAGITYFEDRREQRKKERGEKTRYIITTSIAAAGLILSIISLAAQCNLIRLPGA